MRLDQITGNLRYRASSNPMTNIEDQTRNLSALTSGASGLQNDMFMSVLGGGIDPNATIANMAKVNAAMGLTYGFIQSAMEREKENKRLMKLMNGLALAATA